MERGTGPPGFEPRSQAPKACRIVRYPTSPQASVSVKAYLEPLTREVGIRREVRLCVPGCTSTTQFQWRNSSHFKGFGSGEAQTPVHLGSIVMEPTPRAHMV